MTQVIQTQTLPFLLPRMREAIRYKGHNSIMAYGRKGAGKSTFGLTLGRALLGSWKAALDHVIFAREELLEKLKVCYDYSTTPPKIIYRYNFLMWDDAGYETTKSKFTDRFVDQLAKYYQTVRSVVSNFVWTLPNPQLLSGKLRDMDWTMVRIEKIDPYSFEAHYYKYNISPTGRIYLNSYRRGGVAVIDRLKFTILPPDIRQKYELLRDSYSCTGYRDLVKSYEMESTKNIQMARILANMKRHIEAEFEPFK